MRWTDSECSFSLPVKETESSMRIGLKQIVINDAQEGCTGAGGSVTASQQAASNVFHKRVYIIKFNYQVRKVP